ncbi:hypothetical protein HY638_01085 [Candidatus Woesearchaeota archaeon]|nr:hypothetical protein [Candidatus Woesearchaeota archaeon]
MNHLEYSQQVKAEIENSPLYSLLRNHFIGQKRFSESLGEGDHFRHLKTKRLDSGLWIAIKEPKQEQENPVPLEAHCRATYAFAESYHPAGHKSIQDILKNPERYYLVTSAFCIGVKYRQQHLGLWNYAALVEDLASLSIPIKPAVKSGDKGEVKIGDKTIHIYFDIDYLLEQLVEDMGGEDKIPNCMVDDKMMIFE